MTQKFLIFGVWFMGMVLSLMGCVSSEETGAGDRARSPVLFRIEEAKIGGMTPAVFNLSGRWVLWPP